MTTTAPPSLTPGGRSAMRALFVVVAVALIGGSVLALGVAAFGLSRLRGVADEQALPADMRALVVDTSGVPAAVQLVTDRDATEPRVSMRMVDSGRSQEKTLTVTAQARTATVTVSDRTPGFMRWARTGQITVTLPPALAGSLSITVRQDAGALFARADVDELISYGSDGAVVLTGNARRIEVHNDNGTVVTREPISVVESFTADTDDGDVTVEFADTAPRIVQATTANGDIALGLPASGPYLVRADSERAATVRVPQTSERARAVAEVTARSDDGTVTVSTTGSGVRWHR